MLAALRKLVLEQGSSYAEAFQLKTANGPLDLTGATFDGGIARSYTAGARLVAFTFTPDADPLTGIVTVSLTFAQINALPADPPYQLGVYTWGVTKGTWGQRVFQGDVEIIPKV